MEMLDRIFYSLTNRTKEIDVKTLPSLGIFYPPDFRIVIKKCDMEDILSYEKDFVPNDITQIINLIKRLLSRSIMLPKKYTFDYVKSIDLIYLFLELVTWTNSKKINFNLYHSITGNIVHVVEFGKDSFNYFDTKPFIDNFDFETREFVIDEWRFSVPSVGVETSIMEYLHFKRSQGTSLELLNNLDYNFMYFLGNRNVVSVEEIDNIVTIFNEDLDEDSKKKVTQIVEMFKDLSKYTVSWQGAVYEISNKIDLASIWK